MKTNLSLLHVAMCAIAIQIMAVIFNQHILINFLYLSIGLIVGMLLERNKKQPKLQRTEYKIQNCKIDSSGRADQSSCTVIVMKQYCYIIDTPSPQQICFWVKEEHQGRWNAESGCCEALIDGRLVCVRPH